MVTSAVDTKTNEFLDCGDRPGSIRVELPRNPDPLRERYSGKPESPFAEKSAAEIKDALAASERAAIPRPTVACLLCALEGRLGRAASSDECTKELDRYLVILKGLV